MLKWLLLFLTLVSAAASLLTWLRAPDWRWTWKLAVAVGEYGYWLALLPLGVGVSAYFATDGGVRLAAVSLSVLAASLLLRPVFLAAKLAKKLPAQLNAAFGHGANLSEPAFDPARLYWHGEPPRARMNTEVFSQPAGIELKVDFYTAPFAGDTTRRPPCLVMIHGGGWDGGDRAQLPDWNHRLAARGCAVAAISYRLAPRWIWPAQRDDVLAALAWLKANANRLGIDPTRLVLLGRSAGGQIATAVAYGANDPAIRGVVAFYAPHDMKFAWSVSREDDALNSVKLMRQYFGGPPDTPARAALYESASGQLLARAGSPPTLLLHGLPDTLAWHRHSERLAARLQELGVKHCYLSLPWATHGFDYNPDGPGGQLAGYALRRFLSAVTKPL